MLTLGGVATCFAAASCCALPILLTATGLGAAWLSGVATLAAPHRDLLLWLSALSPACGMFVLWRMQRSAVACGRERGCTPGWLRLALLAGLLLGAGLLWMGSSCA